MTSAGKAAYEQCYSCHAIEPGRNDPGGPTLHAIVGRPIAAEPGFNYSTALRAFARENPRWTPELLDKYVADPARLVPRTSMGFNGMEDAEQRRALIAYLQTLDKPHR